VRRRTLAQATFAVYCQRVAVMASFIVVGGVPFMLGVALGRIPMRWPGKLALGASFPLTVALALLAAMPFSLVDVGIGVVAFLATFAWLFGFALSADLGRLWRVLTR
jgi:hypothetical protein